MLKIKIFYFNINTNGRSYFWIIFCLLNSNTLKTEQLLPNQSNLITIIIIYLFIHFQIGPQIVPG